MVFRNTSCVDALAQNAHGLPNNLSGGSELGDSLGSLGDSVLGELTREDKSDSRLDLSGGASLSLGVSGELSSLNKDTVEDVGDEGVQDAHGLLADSLLGVDLLQDLVDVGGEGLNASLAALLLLVSGCGLGGLGGLLGGSLCHCGGKFSLLELRSTLHLVKSDQTRVPD